MAEDRAFFDAIARRYDREFAFAAADTRQRGRLMLEALGREPRRVLDLGLGTGRELPILLDAGHEVVGVEWSREMIAECNKRARTVPVVCADFYQPLPWPDGEFDAVIALHGTLAHPPNEAALGALFAELRRIVRRRGVLYAEVPSPAVLSILPEASADRHTFVARDEKSGRALRGYAWPMSTWSQLAAGCFHLQERPPPSPCEWALAGTRIDAP